MIRILSRLFRWRLSLMNGVVAVAGFALFPHQAVHWKPLAVLLAAVSLLAAGCSAINQLRERDLDRLMFRTMDRPLPSGELSPRAAGAMGGICLAAGLVLLFGGGGVIPTVPACLVVLWYLGVYTPLKRRSGYSLLLGALCGALPPLIGWSFAGGNLWDFPPLLLALLLYLWQVPHFWLLQRRHAEDYRRAGFRIFDFPSLRIKPGLLLSIWISAIIAATLMFPVFGVIPASGAVSFLALCVPLVLFLSPRLERPLFTYLNCFPLLLAALLIC